MLQRLKSKIKYMSVAKKLSVLLCVILLGTVTAGSTYAYVVTGTPSLVNLFTNGMAPDGNLIIEKNLQHPYGDDYVLPDGLDFDFRVELGDEYAGETVKTTQGNKVADKNGVLNVKVEPGSRATIYDVDGGTKVTVREINLGKGFTAEEQEQELTVKKHKDNVMTFVNTYKAVPAKTDELTVKGSKTLEGRLWQEGDSFTFRMEVLEGGKWVSLGEEEITYKENTEFNKFSFTKYIQEYTFDKVGTYSYRITEVEGNIGGITYDKAESYFDVYIDDADMDGYLEISKIQSMSSNTTVKGTDVTVDFVNTYAPSGSAKVNIDITKQLDDKSGRDLDPSGFTFELLDAEGKVMTTSEKTNVTGKTYISLVFTPADAGKTFEYQLRETNSGEKIDAMKYDDKVYDLKVAVRDDLDGTVSAAITADGKKHGDTFEAVFKNEYDPLNAYLTLKGEKQLEGRALKSGEFEFAMYQVQDDSFGMDGAKLVDKASNESDGDFAFDAQSYNKVGTYRYLIVEDDSDAVRGVSYDDTAYRVTVVVTDDKGQLTIDKSIVDDKGRSAEIVFRNEYDAEPVSWSFAGEKVFKNEDGGDHALKAGQFKFAIYSADKDFVQQGAALETVSNAADGSVKFNDIVFSKSGTFRYVIVEDDSDADSDILYDQSVYCLTVDVDDTGDGQLEVDDVDIEVDGIDQAGIVFTNIYKGEAPTEPSEPSEPSEPTDPSEPDEPTGPSEPSEPGKPTEPSEPVKPTQPGGPDQPTTEFQPQDGLDEPADKDKGTQTGDNFNLFLPIMLLLLSAGVATAAIVVRRKKTV